MKIVVLGAAGMLGHKMFQTLRAAFPGTLATIRGRRSDPAVRGVDLLQGDDVLEGFDASRLDDLRARLRELAPDVVVNCIGMVKQRAEAELPVPTITLNALLPHVLHETCAALGGRLIHVSTDCVFSGKRGSYTEEDPCDAEDLYGRSKSLGEVRGARGLTLRTSIIGRELGHFQSLLEWFLARRGEKIRGFTRALYSGVTTPHLSELVRTVIEKHPGLTGLYQVTSPTIDKYALLGLLKAAFRVPVEIERDDSFFCDRSMVGDRLRAAIGYDCPPWPELVRRLASDPTPYDSWRRSP